MKKAKRQENNKFPLFPKLLATSFGFGFLPVAPGTWGAIFGILVWLPLYILAPLQVMFWVTVGVTIVYMLAATWASGVAEKYWGKDPVIACADETVGQWISLLPMAFAPKDYWWEIFIALALFRFFDIFKPLGIRSLERLPGGVGMMADDILAGIYSAIMLIVLNIIIIY